MSFWYIDSGLLQDFKNINGGYVAFGSKGGRILGQSTISNGTLSFKQVNYVDILDYNMLSISQICEITNLAYFSMINRVTY